jgi:hypothetical protein
MRDSPPPNLRFVDIRIWMLKVESSRRNNRHMLCRGVPVIDSALFSKKVNEQYC